MLKKILFSSMVISGLFASSCWNVEEKAIQEEAELNGEVVFSFKDAVSCEPIKQANVKFLNHNFKTNNKGEIRLPVPPDNIDIKVPLIIKSNGYITLKQNIMVSVGSYWQNKFLLSKTMPINSARFVLSWSDKPKDLDLHLVSDDFHISYRNKTLSSQAKLDRDAMNGYGPETITLNYVNKNKTYKVYIYKYSKNGKLDHNVHLSVYKNNKLNKTISLPDNLNGRCIQVLSIKNNSIDYTIKPVDDKFCKTN